MNPAALVGSSRRSNFVFQRKERCDHVDETSCRLCRTGDAGRVVCDVGTDHAYLPAELLRRGQCTRAVATDIHAGPLEAAKRTLTEAGVLEQAELFLCDGLAQVQPEGITDVVIAGMGGETIITSWRTAPGGGRCI